MFFSSICIKSGWSDAQTEGCDPVPTLSQLCNAYECFKIINMTHIDSCQAGDSIDFQVRDPETHREGKEGAP